MEALGDDGSLKLLFLSLRLGSEWSFAELVWEEKKKDTLFGKAVGLSLAVNGSPRPAVFHGHY